MRNDGVCSWSATISTAGYALCPEKGEGSRRVTVPLLLSWRFYSWVSRTLFRGVF